MSAASSKKRPRRSTVEVSVRVRPDTTIDEAPPWVTANAGFASALVTGSDQGISFDTLGSGLLERLRKGYSCTLLAYGQTGSGKTFTMFGPTGCLTETALSTAGADGVPEAWGIFPRVALALLRSEQGGALQASAIEVYNNVAYDLLNDGWQLQVSRTKPKNTVRVTGGGCEHGDRSARSAGGGDFAHPASCQCRKCFQAKEKAKADAAKARKARANSRASSSSSSSSSSGLPSLTRGGRKRRARGGTGSSSAAPTSFATVGEKLWPIESAGDVARLAMQVESSRRAAGHKLNDRSSRSHCLVRLHLTSSAGGASKGRSAGRRIVMRRQFLFVDLAGSERTRKSGVGGERMAEAKQINQSLTVLGRVIRALGEGKPHVPYRDSTLTMLLRSSFDTKAGAGAGAHASVVIQVAPGQEHKDETICSLRFGSRMARVSNRASVVAATDAGAERAQLRADVATMRRRVKAMADAGAGGGFHPNANLHEKKMLQVNQRKHDEAKRELLMLKKKLAEAGTTRAGKYDRRASASRAAGNGRGGAKVSGKVAELERRVAEAAALEYNIRVVLERQYTIKKLWIAPKPTFLAARAELEALEARLERLG